MHFFITGITGTLGTEITKQLHKSAHQVTGISRVEKSIKNFKHKDAMIYLGDIRDRAKLHQAMYKANKEKAIDIVIHAAALKHVDLGEQYVEQFIETNINGTINVLNEQSKLNIKTVVLPSTDKAVEPINVYGCTKQIAEKLTLKNKNNIVCRYGNVFGSNGSLIQHLKKSLETGKPVGLTDQQMTRYFIDIEDAAKFVIEKSKCPGLHTPIMKSCYISEIMSIFYNKYKQGMKFPITGIRPGEKLHEKLNPGSDSSYNAEKFTKEEILELFEK